MKKYLKPIILVILVLMLVTTMKILYTNQQETLASLTEIENQYGALETQYGMLSEQYEFQIKTNRDLQKEQKKLQETIEQTKETLDKKQETITEQENVIEEQKLELEAKKRSMTVATTVDKPEHLAVSSGWMNFNATHYNADFASTGKRPGHPQYGMTRSGRYVEDGITVAVDPNVIPLGTWVEVKFNDGTTEVRRADDTGGAIKGYKIDLYYDKSQAALMKMGRKSVQVRTLAAH